MQHKPAVKRRGKIIIVNQTGNTTKLPSYKQGIGRYDSLEDHTCDRKPCYVCIYGFNIPRLQPEKKNTGQSTDLQN